jgi:hypothetical protein
MKKLVQKILLLVAIITVAGHSTFPHFHHDDTPQTAQQHHHHNEQFENHHHEEEDSSKENPHSLFSFAQIDEAFVPVKAASGFFEIPFNYLPALIVSFLSDNFPVNIKTLYGWYKEYPPPDNHLFNLPSRAPPALFLG